MSKKLFKNNIDAFDAIVLMGAIIILVVVTLMAIRIVERRQIAALTIASEKFEEYVEDLDDFGVEEVSEDHYQDTPQMYEENYVSEPSI